jgi:predicted ATPase
MHLEQGSKLYDFEQHRILTVHYGQDSGTVCLAYAAWALWMRGYPAQALRRIQEALTLAQELAHPYSQGFTLTFAALLYQWRREPTAVLQHTAMSLALAQQHHFPLLLALSTTLQGWAMVIHGQAAAGLEQLRQGLAAYQATGTGLARPYLLILLAEALCQTGRMDAALYTLAEASALVERHGEYWCQAEVARLQGVFLLQQEPANIAQAETLLCQARDVAHQQQARSFELRATTSLSRLWQRTGQSDRAHSLLEAIYAQFSEGFDTLDLAEAAALRQALS